MKKLMSFILSMSLLVTMFAVLTYAVSVYGSAADMIEAVITAATSDVSSTSLSSAIASTKSKITVSGDEVSFNGDVIGYWYSDSSNVLWADSSKSSVVLQETESGYEALPLTLKTLLTDVNNQLTETITPTTDDWSKIIGKYDVTLGSTTIPVSQQIELTPSEDPITDGYVVRLPEYPDSASAHGIIYLAYLVDANGELYLQGSFSQLNTESGYMKVKAKHLGDTNNTFTYDPYYFPNGGSSLQLVATNYPVIKFGLTTINTTGHMLSSAFVMKSDGTNPCWFNPSIFKDSAGKMYKASDSSQKYTGNVSDAKSCGILYLTSSQFTGDLYTQYTNLFTSKSASKTVRGDSALTRRISKLSSLEAAELLTIKDDGWYTADGTSIDDFIGSQNVGNAGDTADINAIADVEPMSFNVIVPTTLPVYIDAAGVVSTASNATIVNKSNAAVKLQAINIVAVEGSDWTLVESNPSPVRDSKEFTFGTSLTVDTVLAKDEVLPFTYSTKLSPVTDGANSLNLATVQVTVDWAD